MKLNKTVLCIVDCIGVNPETYGNAMAAAGMPNLNKALAEFPSTNLVASGHEVGLADATDAGNSEVGHNAIGAGRRIKQGLALLNDLFASGEIFKTDTWTKLSANAKNKRLHVIVLLSNGRIHSDIAHLKRVLEQCDKENIPVAVHALADGRDVATQSVLSFMKGLEDKIATLAGRGIAFMDRYESNPEILRTGFSLVVEGKGNPGLVVQEEYKKNPTMTDEGLPPMVLNPELLIQNGDSVLLLNYRGDRAVQTCAMFENGKYLTPEQYSKIDKCLFAGALQYDTELGIPKNYLCPPPKIENGLTWWLCKHGVRQFTVTETVKFGHLTYFFNGNRSLPFDEKLEKWQELKSDNVGVAFNTKPAMKAREITQAVIKNLNDFDFIKLNLANPDMVGHTADFDATVEACRVVDECIGKLIQACKQEGVNLVITADHGNAEEMLDKNGKPRSSHTNNPVPFVVLPFAGGQVQLKAGTWGLTNIATGVCKLLGLAPFDGFNEGFF